MTVLLYLTFLVMAQGGHTMGSYVSQLEKTVRVQPGLSTSLKCHVQLDGHFVIFWIKIPPNEAPACIATAKAFVDDVAMCKQFENHSRIKVTWNQKTFNLSFSSVEHTDVATYLCGTYNYGQYFYGNVSKLIFEEHVEAFSQNTPTTISDEKAEKRRVFEYLAATLAATNGALIFLITFLCCRLRKNKSGVKSEVRAESENNTDEVNYAALKFGHKQKRNVQKRTNMDTTVIYGAVQHREEL